MSVTDLLEEALQLSPAERAGLVEKIVESLATDIDPVIERAHLDEIARRRQQNVKLHSGPEVLSRARALLAK
jgi:putative addiction module component (TIGR02574 family)